MSEQKTLGEWLHQSLDPGFTWRQANAVQWEKIAAEFRDEVLRRERVRVNADGKTPGQVLFELFLPNSDWESLCSAEPKDIYERWAATLLDAFGDAALRERLETERQAAKEAIDELRAERDALRKDVQHWQHERRESLDLVADLQDDRERMETERAAAKETIDALREERDVLRTDVQFWQHAQRETLAQVADLREQLAAERAAATDRLDAELAIASATTEELTKLRTAHSRSGLQTRETFAWGTVVEATMDYEDVLEINA